MNTDITTVVAAAKQNFVACRGSDLSFEKEARFAVQALLSNKYALKIATSTPVGRQSVIDAVTNIASIGVSLNPARKQAYLVPRRAQNEDRICLDISYQGLIDIAVQSGSIKWAQAKIVHENDFFEISGVDKEPTHRYQPFSDRGQVVGAYVTVKTIDDDYLTESMSVIEINEIRDRSEFYKNKKAGPWKDFWEEMAKKTVVKRAQKYWPKTDRLSEAIKLLNEDSGEGINFDEETASLKNEIYFKWESRIKSENNINNLREIFKQASKECKNLNDSSLQRRIKSALMKRYDEINGEEKEPRND